MIAEVLLALAVWIVQVFLGTLLILGFARIVPAQWQQALIAPLKRFQWSFVVIAVLLPALFLFRDSVYPWHDVGVFQGAFAKLYFSSGCFFARLLFDLVLWGFLIYWLRKSSGTRRAAAAGVFTVISVLLTGTQFCFDWILSLQVHHTSTAMGLVFLLSGTLLAFALSFLELKQKTSDKNLLDLGNIHLALIATWSYVTFMEFLVVWSGNLPDEVGGYITRLQTSWRYVFLGLVIFQFAIPLLLLPFRKFKTFLPGVKLLAWTSVGCQTLFSFSLTQPSLHPTGSPQPFEFLVLKLLIVVCIGFMTKSVGVKR